MHQPNTPEEGETVESIAYYDGTVGSPDELVVPFNDRVHFFGDGIYEASMVANGKIFAIEDHLDRLFSSAVVFGINIPCTKQELNELLHDLASKIDAPSQFAYWQVTRGVAPREHTYDPNLPGKLWVTIRAEKLYDPMKPMKLITLEDKRFAYGNVKTLNLLPAVKYSQEARMAGVNEAVLHRDGVVTECAHSNVSILKDGVLYSHPNDEYILRGIAKTHLIQACYRESVPVIERAFTLEQLMDADEIIVTSSSHPCTFADSVDGIAAGGRDPETLGRLRDAVYGEYLEYTGASSLQELVG